MTKNAKYILEIINNSSSHLTAEQIFLLMKEKNKTVVQATVYNNLSSLYRNGLIRKISVEGYPTDMIKFSGMIIWSVGNVENYRISCWRISLKNCKASWVSPCSPTI